MSAERARQRALFGIRSISSKTQENGKQLARALPAGFCSKGRPEMAKRFSPKRLRPKRNFPFSKFLVRNSSSSSSASARRAFVTFSSKRERKLPASSSSTSSTQSVESGAERALL